MNIFLFEIKTNIKSMTVWTISIVAVLSVFMAGIYPVFAKSLDSVLKILAGFPKEFSEAFGINLTAMFSYEGFYFFAFNYISLFGAVMTVNLTLSVFAREKRAKCMDFILTKPRSRKKIFLYKLLSVTAFLVLSNIAFAAATIILCAGSRQVGMNRFLLVSVSLFLTELLFLIFAVVFAVFSAKVRTISGISAAVGVGAFLLSALTNIFDEKYIIYFAPLKYFDPVNIFAEGGFNPGLFSIGILLIAAGGIVSFLKFCKSDVHTI